MNFKELKKREEELSWELKNIRHRRNCLKAHVVSVVNTWMRNNRFSDISPIMLDNYLTEVTDEDTSREEMMNFIQKKLDEGKI